MWLRPFMLLVCVSIFELNAFQVLAQTYPDKPIRIITAETGGGQDLVARLIAQGLGARLNQSVVVENRGGSVVIQGEYVARSGSDGYTLSLAAGNLWIVSLLQKTSYDPIKDFTPISLTNRAPNVLVVHPLLAVKSVAELVAMAKAKPGGLNYGSGPTGSSNHLAAELFNSMAGVNIVRVAYKGSGPALSALVSGELQLSFPSASSVTQHIKSGRLRGLAVTSLQPSVLAPGLPTVAASGLTGYESEVIYGLLGPAKMPQLIVKRLNQELVAYLGQTEVKEKFLNLGVETVGSNPDQLAATIKSDITILGKVITNAGIRAE